MVSSYWLSHGWSPCILSPTPLSATRPPSISSGPCSYCCRATSPTRPPCLKPWPASCCAVCGSGMLSCGYSSLSRRTTCLGWHWSGTSPSSTRSSTTTCSIAAEPYVSWSPLGSSESFSSPTRSSSTRWWTGSACSSECPSPKSWGRFSSSCSILSPQA